MSATTTTTPATNVLDARPKGAAAGLPTTSKADGVAQSLAANPGELSGPCRQAISGMAKNEALATCTNLFDMVQIRTAKDSISAPIKVSRNSLPLDLSHFSLLHTPLVESILISYKFLCALLFFFVSGLDHRHVCSSRLCSRFAYHR
jgi:hypothetical protein